MRLERQIVFDPFSLDLANERLCRGKEEIRLHPKAFAVLRYLIERPRGLVTKDTLLEKVWPGLHVTEGVLTESIREIRKALGDDSKKPHFIGTVHRRGYRFLAPVTNGSQTSAAITKQEIRFCSTGDGVRIAYSTMGKGPPLVIPPQLVTHLEADLVEGPLADVYEALARHHTLVRFDLRGTGLSDRNVSLSSEELFVLDLEAVVDELGLQLFPLYGLCGGGRLALHYYSRHPARVSHLIFYGTDPEASGDERKKQRNVTQSVIQASWKVGSKLTMEHLMPHGGTREDIERLARWLQISVASDVAQKLIELRQDRSDLGPLLAKVSVPTLVIHRRGDHVPFVGGRELAAKIRSARFLPLEGYNHLPATHEEAMELVTPVVEFLAKGYEWSGARSVDLGAPITLLFSDIEGSNSLTTRLHAKEVQKLVHAHNDTVRRAIESYNGNEVQYTGNGIGASFFSASRAVGCALYIQQAFVKRNAANPEDAVNVRIGVTVAEPIADDNDAFCASGQVARQICELANPGQVLVSDLVRQIVDGKGFLFEPLGTKMFSDFAEPVTLHKLRLE